MNTMRFYPVLLDIKDRLCLVVGGGEVGARKAKTLASCGARVNVISPEFSERFNDLNDAFDGISLIPKAFEPDDLSAAFLVFAATSDPALNLVIRQEAEEKGMLCNSSDGDDHGDFILPSVMHKGDLILAVSTCGKSPALARKIRRDLEENMGPGIEKLLCLMGGIRKKLLAQGHAPDDHKTTYYALLDAGLMDMVAAEDTDRIDRLLADVLGKGYIYKELVSQRSGK